MPVYHVCVPVCHVCMPVCHVYVPVHHVCVPVHHVCVPVHHVWLSLVLQPCAPPPHAHLRQRLLAIQRPPVPHDQVGRHGGGAEG